MKKITSILILILCFFAPAHAAVGIGGEAAITAGPYYNHEYIFTVSREESPWAYYILADPWNLALDIAGDNWFIYDNISGRVNYFLSYGFYAGLELDEDFRASFGPRAGMGLNMLTLDSRALEFYTQVNWMPYASISHDNSWDFTARPFCFPVAAGCRWWFR